MRHLREFSPDEVLQIKTKLNETELSVVSEQWSTISLPVSLRTT